MSKKTRLEKRKEAIEVKMKALTNEYESVVSQLDSIYSKKPRKPVLKVLAIILAVGALSFIGFMVYNMGLTQAIEYARSLAGI